MDIPDKLLQYRYHLTIAAIVPLVLSLLLYAAPRLLTILAYFWPLFASTAVLLMALITFGGLSQFSNEAHGEKADAGIIDYVGGQPEHS